MSNEVKVRFTGDDANLKKTAADVKRAVKGVADEAKKQKSAVDSLRASWGKLTGAVAAVGAAYASLRIVRDSVRDAMKLNEAVAKTEDVFGNAADRVKVFAQGAAKSLGQSSTQAMQAANSFALFGSSAGLAEDDLADFSIKLTSLAGDMASFNDTSPEETIQAIGAALRGESEPIRRFGVLINEAALKDEALRQGIIKTTSQALTPQQRVLAAYNLILEQTKDQQGDFAKYSGSLGNQLQTLKASLADISAELGENLIPAATNFVTFLNDNTIPAIIGAKAYADEFAESLANLASKMGIGGGGAAEKNFAGSAVAMLIPGSGAVVKILDLQDKLAKKGREVQQAQKEAADAIAKTGSDGAAAFSDMHGKLEDVRITTMNLLTEMNDLSIESVRLFEDEGVALLHNQDLLNSQIRLQKASKQVADDAKAAAEAIKLEKQKELDLELRLAQAKAAGNKEEEKRLEWIQRYQEAVKRGKEAGMTGAQAHDYATAMANAVAPEASGLVVAGPPSGAGGAILTQEASLENFQRNPANYFPTGHPRAGQMRPEALGRLRGLQRRNAYAQQREARRLERGGGGAVQTEGTGAAATLADEMFKKSREADRAAQQASQASSPAAEIIRREETDNQLLKKIHEVLDQRLPEGTT